MPELPEVETIRRGLDRSIVGLRITALKSLHPKSLQLASEQITRHVLGAKITALDRRAKVLVIELDSGYSLLFHLKMTGQLVLVSGAGERFAGGHPTKSMAEQLPDRSTKAIFELSDGSTLYFNDQRIFGWIKLVPTTDVIREQLIAKLGPEPLSEKFDLDGFKERVSRRRKSPIKAVILDQSVVGGVGNIYADESLHLAKINPATLAGDLKPDQIELLHSAIKTIIALGIEHGGTSFTSYVNALGQTGDYLQHARVFRRQGLQCPVCGDLIIKTRVAGRGTHYCPTCQPPPKGAGGIK